MINTDYSTLELSTVRPSNGELAARPVVGEQTGNQGLQGTGIMGATSIGGIAGGVMTFANALDGFGKSPPPTVHTYRLMRNNANVAIARMAIQAPVKAASWTIQEDDGAPAGAADLIQSVIDHQTAILEHALRMFDYGRSSFELVWSADTGAIVPDKFKPLLVDLTTINVDKEHGAYAGLTNGRAKLSPENTLHFVFDGEAGDYYGRSLFENIRSQAWWPWLQTLRRAGQFSQKVAGPTLMVRYVPGKGRGRTGTERDNFEMAVEVAQAFGRGDAVVIPMTFAPWAEDMIRQGVDPAKLLAWQVDLMEPGTGHASEFIAMIRMFEASILRGLMVPERVVTEGKFGTKAESESQAEIAIAFSQEVLLSIVDCLNWYVVDRIMRLNFGEASVGTVQIIAESLIDEKRALIREMVKGLLGSAANVDVWQTLTDVEAQLDLLGIPVSQKGEANTMAEELAKSMRGQLGAPPVVPVEPIAASMELDCGTGAGGFKSGNSCGGGGGGGVTAKRFKSGSDAESTLSKASKSFEDGLEYDDKQGIAGYAGTSDSFSINSSLRSGTKPSTPTQKATLDRLTNTLNKASFPQDAESFRVIKPKNQQERDAILKSFQSSVGSSIQDKAFVSTTANKAYAKKWGKGSAVEPIEVTVRVPKGAKAAYLSKNLVGRQEWEVVIQRNSKFKVVGVKGNSVTIELEK